MTQFQRDIKKQKHLSLHSLPYKVFFWNEIPWGKPEGAWHRHSICCSDRWADRLRFLISWTTSTFFNFFFFSIVTIAFFHFMLALLTCFSFAALSQPFHLHLSLAASLKRARADVTTTVAKVTNELLHLTSQASLLCALTFTTWEGLTVLSRVESSLGSFIRCASI